MARTLRNLYLAPMGVYRRTERLHRDLEQTRRELLILLAKIDQIRLEINDVNTPDIVDAVLKYGEDRAESARENYAEDQADAARGYSEGGHRAP